ncbi:MAG: prepilin-type N-terminal cleavage/methylation domain-containing protein [Pseudomonadota bacterium]
MRVLPRQAGFTLVEILLAMTLVGLILAMAYGGLSTSAKAVDRGQDVVDRSNHLRIVHQFTRRQLAQAMPLQIEPEDALDEDQLVYFEGDDRMVHFAAPMPGYLSSGGPHDQKLFFDSGPNGLELLFEHKVIVRDEDWVEEEERDPVVLLDGIRRGQFSFMLLDEDGEPEWVEDWEDPALLPVAIRVEIEMEPSTRIHWPTLDVRPVIDTASARRQLDRPFVLPGGRNN